MTARPTFPLLFLLSPECRSESTCGLSWKEHTTFGPEDPGFTSYVDFGLLLSC